LRAIIKIDALSPASRPTRRVRRRHRAERQDDPQEGLPSCKDAFMSGAVLIRFYRDSSGRIAQLSRVTIACATCAQRD
jgi:hypothetical protein